jgi:hypothetical protein
MANEEEKMFTRAAKDYRLPAGPDEMIGATEGSKAWIGILIALALLAVLIWTAIAIA